jgi:hypothetical protein
LFFQRKYDLMKKSVGSETACPVAILHRFDLIGEQSKQYEHDKRTLRTAIALTSSASGTRLLFGRRPRK